MSSVSIERILGFKDKREKRFHHPNLDELQGWRATQDEKNIPKDRLNEEKSWALKMGLTGADSIEDRSIPYILTRRTSSLCRYKYFFESTLCRVKIWVGYNLKGAILPGNECQIAKRTPS